MIIIGKVGEKFEDHIVRSQTFMIDYVFYFSVEILIF